MNSLRNRFSIIKPNKIIALGFFIYIISRIIFLMISISFKLQPFLSYDDIYFYDAISLDELNSIQYYFFHRQFFYIIAATCNILRINEVLTGTRLFNFIVYFLCCCCIRNICINLKYDKKVQDKIFLGFLILPYYFFYSVSTYKDLLCMYSLLSLFNIYFKYKNKERISILKTIIFCTILFFVRFGILESFIMLIWGVDFIKKKDFKKYGIVILFLIVAFLLFANENYVYMFEDKYNAYIMGGHSSKGSTGLLGKIEVTGLKNIYNIIPLILYGQIIPLPGSYMNDYLQANSWGAIIGYFGFVSAFLIPYFWRYIFYNKKSNNEKIIIIFYILWIVAIMISNPGTSRFLFFITPIFYFISMKSLIGNLWDFRLLAIGVIFSIIPFIYLCI